MKVIFGLQVLNDDTGNDFSIKVKPDDTIHDSILNNLEGDIRGKIEVFFGGDMIGREEHFEDHGIEEGARLQIRHQTGNF